MNSTIFSCARRVIFPHRNVLIFACAREISEDGQAYTRTWQHVKQGQYTYCAERTVQNIAIPATGSIHMQQVCTKLSLCWNTFYLRALLQALFKYSRYVPKLFLCWNCSVPENIAVGAPGRAVYSVRRAWNSVALPRNPCLARYLGVRSLCRRKNRGEHEKRKC